MATVVQTTLQISEATVEQYCTADGLSLNTGGYAIRLYLNGHTQGSAILNDAAKEVLYPSATTHPFKIDSFMRANKSGGSMTISLQFGGTDVHSESSGWGTGLKDKTKEGIADSVVINSNRSTEIKWHIKGSSTVSRFSIASTKLTFYFNQYEMQSLVGNNANGIQEATVSNASPYQGDTVVFTPKLVQGATWVGWYSDAACTNLVSTDQNYSVSPTSDLILYAKATHDAELFTCAAVAGANMSSVSVSDSIVPANGSCTFSATANTGCTFEGWYLDESCTNLVSTENPYIATITANTTLYAKAHISNLNISVGQAEYGTASVNAFVINYGDNATFTFTPESNDYELYGWYADKGLTQLISEENPYTCAPTTDYKLYPKTGFKRYEITLTKVMDPILYVTFTLKMASVYYDQLTSLEKRYIKTGEFDKIDQSKIYEGVKSDSSIPLAKNLTISTKAPINTTCILWVGTNMGMGLIYSNSTMDDASMASNWPYCIFTPTQDATYYVDYAKYKCVCSAIGKNGITYADATTPTRRNYEAEFTAELENGYQFKGWYSDEACTNLISIDNPARIKTPTSDEADTSLTLYALGEKATYNVGVGTSQYGTAIVSASTVQYGNEVTFTATPSSKRYEFLGWYSDAAYINFVSSDNPYSCTATMDITLYPKFGIKTYNLIVHPTGYDKINFKGATNIENVEILYKNSSKETSTDAVATWAIGELNKSDNPASAGFFVDGARFSSIPTNATITSINVSMKAKSTNDTDISITCNTSCGFYTAKRRKTGDSYSYVQIGKTKYKDVVIIKNNEDLHSYYVTYTISNKETGEWTVADLKSGSFGLVWLVSSPSITSNGGVCKHLIHNIDISVSYTLLDESTTSTTLYFKTNGSYKSATRIYKKVSGTWVEQTDLPAIFSGESSGTASNYVYGGSA